MSTHEKMMSIDCKLGDKNLEKMLTDGVVDDDMGMQLPIGTGALSVKTEEVDEDVQKAKDAIADLKLT